MYKGRIYCRIGFLTLIVALVFAVWTTSCKSDKTKDPNKSASNSETVKEKEKPIIIWFHNGVTDSPKALKLALSSNLITHVMIKYMHRADADWEKKLEVRRAIEIVKNSDAQLIWCRNMWTYYNNKNAKKEDLFDPNYYIKEILALRAEASKMGADSVAFDLEAYGNSPMCAYMKGDVTLSGEDLQGLKSVIKKVINEAGKVDFILPAGWRGNRMPYDILAELGANRISESTYYFNYERIKKIKTPYEIFGAYVNTSRRREVNPSSPYFLASDVFENSHLWSDKKGLFLYPREKNALAVAKELAAYSRTLPYKNEMNEHQYPEQDKRQQ